MTALVHGLFSLAPSCTRRRLPVVSPHMRPVLLDMVRWKSNAKRISENIPTSGSWKRLAQKMDEAAHNGEIASTEKMGLEAIQKARRLGEREGTVRMLYNTILKACANKGDPGRARHWYETMKREGVKPNMKTFGKLLEASAKGGDIEAAVKWLDTALDEMGELNEVILGTMVDVCAKARRPDLAKKYLAKFKVNGLDIPLPARGSLLNALARQSKVDEAAASLGNMEKMKLDVDVRHYSTVVHAYGSAGKPVQAQKWFDRMKSKGFEPDVPVWTALIGAYAKLGLVDTAEKLFGEMRKAKAQPNEVTYTNLLTAHSRSPTTFDIKAARIKKLIGDMRRLSVKINLPAWNIAIKHCTGNGGSGKDAVNLFKEMKKCQTTPDYMTYSEVMYSFNRVGQWREAVQWMDRYLQSGIERGTTPYAQAIRAVGNLGDVKGALGLLQKMSEAELKPTPPCYHSAVIIALNGGPKGALKQIEELLQEMEQTSVVPDKAFEDKISKVYGQHHHLTARVRDLRSDKKKAAATLAQRMLRPAEFAWEGRSAMKLMREPYKPKLSKKAKPRA